MRYALRVIYDGTCYCGWQVQKNGITVQSVLQDAIYTALNEKVTVTASGRTDSGVHANYQVCHVDLSANIPGERLADAINPHLPMDVVVASSCIAPEGFDANRSAKKKTYVYSAYLSSRRHPLKDRYSAWVKGDISGDKAEILSQKLKEVATLFVGEHDFKAYCASGSQVLTTVRTIYSLDVNCTVCDGALDVKISVCGNGFLYNMVRTIAGTLLYCALGRLTLQDVKGSIENCNRALVGKTMPACGLTLQNVDYGVKLF